MWCGLFLVAVALVVAFVVEALALLPEVDAEDEEDGPATPKGGGRS